MSGKRNEIMEKLKARLDKWSAEIDRLEAEADRAEAERKIEYQKRIEELKAKRRESEEKIENMNRAGEEAWQDLKDGVRGAMSAFGEAIKLATSRFK